MPRAIPLAIRQEIVRRHLDGQALARIAEELHLPWVTVRALWRRFRDRGDDGLDARYAECGRATPGHPQAVLRRACRLKREHPTWGAGRVRVELLGQLGPAPVPAARTLQRAFQREGINRPRRPQRPRAARIRPGAPHDLWEVDAVEKQRLRDGEEVSWMTVVDVCSGALLAAELSPPGRSGRPSPRSGPGPCSAASSAAGRWPRCRGAPGRTPGW